MFSHRDVIQINQIFDTGKVINKSSLDFAVSSAQNSKDWITQLAFILRAIVVDHIFEEGNKRTASALFVAYCKMHQKRYDLYKIDLIIKNLIQKNETNIKN